MVDAGSDVTAVWGLLATIPDPEIPVISICDLGIVRDVRWANGASEGTLHVSLTPTYSGCPALRAIEGDVVARLREAGFANVVVDLQLAPAWTTDWLTARGRENLRAYGIAPPRSRAVDPDAPIDLIGFVDERVACPRCASEATELVSRFGSTPCKALYRCTACREPFDHFKQH